MKIFVTAALALLALASLSYAQQLPDKIRGYKVHTASMKISHTIPPGDKLSDDFDLYVQIGRPNISMRGLLAASIEIGSEMVSTKQSGTVEMMTFHNIKVNGVEVEVDEYAVPMTVEKGIRSALPKPVTARLNLAGTAKTALKELTDSREQWRVTGTAFVFGKFKKFGFSFKRVIPVEIDMLIDNPLK